MIAYNEKLIDLLTRYFYFIHSMSLQIMCFLYKKIRY